MAFAKILSVVVINVNEESAKALSSTPFERNICNSRIDGDIPAPTLVQVTSGGAGKESDGVAKNRLDYFEAFADGFG